MPGMGGAIFYIVGANQLFHWVVDKLRWFRQKASLSFNASGARPVGIILVSPT
jgi:hypothetical protein